MFPLPPTEAVFVAEVYRHFPDTREVDIEPVLTPPAAIVRDDRAVLVDGDTQVSLWDAA